MKSEIPILVRYAETDRMGVVHHARYFEYLEMGRVDLMKRTGISYRELEERGALYPLVESWIRYRKPVTFDDPLTLITWYRRLTRTRVTFAYRLLTQAGATCAEALTMHAQIDGRGRPQPLDAAVARAVRENLVDEDPTPSRLWTTDR
ncbi:MAG: acyl-CoA thioesterase [Candidatus Riflebacteria bacterium]|nr:acyl-CoA thioesterase [Candidatus Riflebacteria bacterium]